jgi:hypothetical protein
MKTIYLILVIVLCCSIQSLFSQEQKKRSGDDVYFSKKSVSEMSVIADKSQADHITSCLIKQHNERQTAYVLAIAAGVLGSVSGSVDPGSKDAVLIGSGVVGLTGLIMFIASERWTSKRKLTYTGSGLSYRF